MGDLTIPDAAQEAALQAVIDVRDASPRVPNDADSFDVAMAALLSGDCGGRTAAAMR